jgi:hypothetical protein
MSGSARRHVSPTVCVSLHGAALADLPPLAARTRHPRPGIDTRGAQRVTSSAAGDAPGSIDAGGERTATLHPPPPNDIE